MQKEKNKKKNLLIWAIVALCISFVGFLISFYIQSSVILEKYEIYASLSIGDIAGMDVNSTALTLGGLIYGSSSGRKITLENNYDFPVVYYFKVEGDISNFLIFDREVHLEPGENKTISISTSTITDEEHGDYDGFLKVVVKKDI